MWQAFVTGFSKQASSLIEERDKEIKDTIENQLNLYYKKATENKKIADTRRDKLREYAQDLSSFQLPDGTKLTESQKIAILESGQAEDVVKLFKDAAQKGELSKEQFKGITPTDEKEKRDVASYIKEMSTIRKREGADMGRVADQTKGAFGLPSGRVVTAATQAFLGKAGMTEEELLGELPEKPFRQVPIQYDVFAGAKKPRGVVELENELADFAAKRGISVDEAKLTDEGKDIAARIDGRIFLEAQRKGSTEDKQRTAAQIVTNLDRRIRRRFASLEASGTLRWEPDTLGGGRYAVLLPGSPDAKTYQKELVEEAKDYFTNTRLVDADGKILGGRNAADALDAWAFVDYDNMKIKGWRPIPQEATRAAPTPTPSGGRGAPSAPKGAPAAAPATGQPAATQPRVIDTAAGPISIERLRSLSKAQLNIETDPTIKEQIRNNFKQLTNEEL